MAQLPSPARAGHAASWRDERNQRDAVFVKGRPAKWKSVLCQNCVTYSPKPWSNTVIYGGHVEAHRCCGKLLIGSVLG